MEPLLIQEVLRTLPHRFPFVLVDRVLRVYTPTVLTVSGLALAGWLAGSWLLAGEPDLHRAVFAAVGVLVTSGYHVPRVADLARSAGLTALLAGAPAVGLPWARVVRHEVVMTLGRHPVVHALAALAVCVVVPAVVVLTR